MPSIILTQPIEEPVTLVEARAHLRVEIADDDAMITRMISDARVQAETICRRALCTQTVKMVLDQFPQPGMSLGAATSYGPQWGTSPGPVTSLKPAGKSGFEMFLPLAPIQSVTSIKYIDPTTGVQTILDPSQYKVDTISEPARITPAYGSSWPSARSEINAVEVVYVAGYGAATAVPAGIKSWMLMRIGAMYESRLEFEVGARLVAVDIPFVDRLLDPYRIIRF